MAFLVKETWAGITREEQRQRIPHSPGPLTGKGHCHLEGPGSRHLAWRKTGGLLVDMPFQSGQKGRAGQKEQGGFFKAAGCAGV